jgi:hypothetical protein
LVIKLRKYQEDAVKLGINVSNTLMCLATGTGKTVISMFLMRLLMKKGVVDKCVVGCTKSSVNVFIDDFKEKANIDVKLVEDIDSFLEFLDSDKKVVLVKHSLLSDMGKYIENVELLKDYFKKSSLKLFLTIDEAHLMSNHDGVMHKYYENIKFIFNKVSLLTATPYSSKLEQIYGLIHLIYPKLWNSLREFKSLYIEEEMVKDWKTGKFLRNETISYKNLKHLRKTMAPFSFFYFPEMDVNYHVHSVKLKDYSEYNALCAEVLDIIIERQEKKEGE